MTVDLTPQARRDIAQVAMRYEGLIEGLGDRFITQVESALERIESNPRGYSLAYRQLRKCHLRKFPYALWFEIMEDNSLIVACLHHRRSRVLVKERATGVVEMPKQKDPPP